MVNWKVPKNVDDTTEELIKAGFAEHFLNKAVPCMTGAWLWVESPDNNKVVVILQLKRGSQHARLVGRDIMPNKRQQEVIARLLGR